MAKTTDELLGELGQQVRALRIAADLSQRELADVVSSSENTIARLEAGRPVSTPVLIATVRALDRGDWLKELDPIGDGPSPIELLRIQQGHPPRRSRVSRRR